MPLKKQKKQIQDIKLSDRRLYDPTRPENWLPDPENVAKLEIWIARTQGLLLKWMIETRDRAQDAASKEKISKFTERADRRWSELEALVDTQTGLIPIDEQAHVTKTMSKEKAYRRNLHRKLLTSSRHSEHELAQIAWEDFLYYQNEWNRKRFDPNRDFFLSKVERYKKKADQREKTTGHDSESNEEIEKGMTEAEGIHIGGGENPKSSMETSGSSPSYEPVKFELEDYVKWRNHVIGLYIKFGIGSRDQMPAVVSPEAAHRYSQSVRGTTNQSSDCGKQRFHHLEVSFLRWRENDTNEGQTTTQTTKRKKALHDASSKSKESSSTTWRVDDVACERVQKAKNKEYLEDPKTKALLPANHVLHHGSLETSFDWSTSFDSPLRRNFVSLTATRLEHIYEGIDKDENAPNDQQNTYQGDEKGENIDRVEAMSRRETQGKTIPRALFAYRYSDKNGAVGQWEKQYVNKPEPNTSKRRKRPTCRIQREFQTFIIPAPEGPGSQELDFRSNRPEQGGKGQELSADEAEDVIKSNPSLPFSISAHREPSSTVEIIGSEDNEYFGSDDDGDLFTSSYKECF